MMSCSLGSTSFLPRRDERASVASPCPATGKAESPASPVGSGQPTETRHYDAAAAAAAGDAEASTEAADKKLSHLERIRNSMLNMTPEEQAVLASVFEKQLDSSKAEKEMKWSLEGCLREMDTSEQYAPLTVEHGGDVLESRVECCVRCDTVRPCFSQSHPFRRKQVWLCCTCILARHITRQSGDWMPWNDSFEETSSLLLSEINKIRQLSISPEQWQIRLCYEESLRILLVVLAEVRGLEQRNTDALHGSDHFRAAVCLMPGALKTHTFRTMSTKMPAVEKCEVNAVFYFEDQDPSVIESSSLCIVLFPVDGNEILAKVEYPLRNLHLNEKPTFVQLFQPASASESRKYRDIVDSMRAEQRARSKHKVSLPANILRRIKRPQASTTITSADVEKEKESRVHARGKDLRKKLARKHKLGGRGNRADDRPEAVPIVPDLRSLFASSMEDDVDVLFHSVSPRLPSLSAANLKETVKRARSFVEKCATERQAAMSAAMASLQERDKKQGLTLLQMSCKSYEQSEAKSAGEDDGALFPKLVFSQSIFEGLREEQKLVYVLRSMVAAEELQNQDKQFPRSGEAFVDLAVSQAQDEWSGRQVLVARSFEKYPLQDAPKPLSYRYLLLRLVDAKGECVGRLCTYRSKPRECCGKETTPLASLTASFRRKFSWLRAEYDQRFDFQKDLKRKGKLTRPILIQVLLCGPRCIRAVANIDISDATKEVRGTLRMENGMDHVNMSDKGQRVVMLPMDMLPPAATSPLPPGLPLSAKLASPRRALRKALGAIPGSPLAHKPEQKEQRAVGSGADNGAGQRTRNSLSDLTINSGSGGGGNFLRVPTPDVPAPVDGGSVQLAPTLKRDSSRSEPCLRNEQDADCKIQRFGSASAGTSPPPGDWSQLPSKRFHQVSPTFQRGVPGHFRPN